MIDYPHLATRLFNRPVAITPDKAEIVMAALADRLGIAKLFRPSGDTVILHTGALDPAGAAPKRDVGYDVVAGVAVIPIAGTLVQKLGTLRPYSGMMGYDGIRLNFMAALADDDVEAIVLDIDSPGGEVAGCFDLADLIYNARGMKPVWAILDEAAYSAAYAIASAADRITVPRTGGAGSVGVVCMHVDLSQALGKAGIEVTMIQYGARKTDAYPYNPLTKDALARFQADVDAMGSLFVETVARNRGMKASAVKNTEASTFLGADGVSVGFADSVQAPDAAFRSLLASLD